MANKNSIYIQSLVDFLGDTKPYRSKLTEIIEECHFTDEMTVNIDERQFSSTVAKAAWPYSYFSGGPTSSIKNLGLHQLVSPQFRLPNNNSEGDANRGAFKAYRDESTDLPLVPFTFDPTCLQGTGISDAFIQRNGVLAEPLLEGYDFFQSHGAHVFQIKRTTDLQGAYTPSYTERTSENLLLTATTSTQLNALNGVNPDAAISKINLLLSQISDQLNLTPNAPASTALTALQVILAAIKLPNSYEALLNALVVGSTPVLNGYAGWVGQDTSAPYSGKFVNQTLSSYSPSLYFNKYNDISAQENGALLYTDITQSGITVSSIVSSTTQAAYEEWTIEISTASVYVVRGSTSGLLGYGVLGTPFVNQRISFNIQGTGTQGTKILLTPQAPITIHQTAPLEAWSLIKVNPIAYSRPILSSTRYGYITNSTGVINQLTITDIAYPTGTIQLRAIDALTFKLTCTAQPGYAELVTVNTLFNNGRLIFTINSGSACPFKLGDVFYFEVLNSGASALEHDLYFGYDMDSYDADSLVYNTVNSAVADYLSTINFGYDSRFTAYDLNAFGLQVTKSAVNGRQWRLRAIADLTRPLSLQAINQGSINVLATDDPTNPNATAQFTGVNDIDSQGIRSATDPDNNGSVQVWYSTSFALEYLDSSTGWVQIDTVPVNGVYTSALHGISFTLVNALKPFISTKLHSSWYATAQTSVISSEDVLGGDIISWTILNQPPTSNGSGLVSINAPRLIMHGNSYQSSIPAQYILTWNSGTQYTLQGWVTADSSGAPIFPTALSINLANGRSFRNDDVGVHFTVLPSANGLDAKDVIKFETFSSKPSYLVYGSVSGWQPNAELGKWYWNGKIGFKLALPVLEVFEGGLQVQGATSIGTITIDRVRQDARNFIYTLYSQNDGHWMLYRNGALVADGASGTQIRDKYLWITTPALGPLGTATRTITLQVTTDGHALSLGHDLAIIRTNPARMPSASDFILIERTKSDTLAVAIKSLNTQHEFTLHSLAPVRLDARLIDSSTVSLLSTSPETSISAGWIPTLLTFKNSAGVSTEFNDSLVSAVLHAAATGETIGTAASTGLTPSEPVIFQWDAAFHDKYLPLNSSATIVTFSSGMNELAHVNMSEGIMFLIGAGGLVGDTLFKDTMSVSVQDTSVFKLTMTQSESTSITVADGPFNGFLPGYDNLPYDFELGVGDVNGDDGGSFDLGVPLTSQFMQAKDLATLGTRTAVQQALLNDLTGELQFFLVNGDILQTSLDYFITSIGASPPKSGLLPELGILGTGFSTPSTGMGVSIQMGLTAPTSSTVSASAQVQEAMVILGTDTAYSLDQFTYSHGPMDASTEFTAYVLCTVLPPAPAVGQVYDTFMTPLLVTNARVIELSFATPLTRTPTIYIWRATCAVPELVSILERVTSNLFRFSIPRATELKLIVLP